MSTTYTAFRGPRRLASGAPHEVAAALAQAPGDAAMPLVFDDATGRQIELDVRGTPAQLAARYQTQAEGKPSPSAEPADASSRARGRPRLGVVAREVTLLPDHWEWLSGQPGGASVALRKLVHDAMRAGATRERERRAQERAYSAMVPLAGDRPGFEEAARALFAGDRERLGRLIAPWPADVRTYLLRLADPGFDATASSENNA